MKVGLFVTCLADVVAPEVGIATVTLLRRLGVEVVFPEQQGCCGQMHVNSGYADQAAPMVRSFVEAFADCNLIVSPSGSCVGSIRHQHRLVAEQAGDHDLVGRVEETVPRVRELTEFLVDDLDVTDVGASFAHSVAYHPSCHSLRVARVGDRPYRLLREVRGLHLVEQDDATGCCGFGGTFAVKNSDVSSAILADKLAAFAVAGAEYVTSLDASCLMHLGGGARRAASGLRTVHLVQILAGTADG
jgi:L-lactate dehydrogenase complex protein LldE